MNPHTIRRLFPNASKSVIAANAADFGTGTPDDPARAQIPRAEPVKPKDALAGAGEGEAQGAGRPILRFTHRRCRMLDWEAKHYALKSIIDGLRYAGLIPGDREDQIDPKSSVTQERVRHRADEEIVIEITLP